MPRKRNVVLVTGGTGLVGKALDYVTEKELYGTRYSRDVGETWYYIGTADADLRCD
jgi:GDP-L-fucose synthase